MRWGIFLRSDAASAAGAKPDGVCLVVRIVPRISQKMILWLLVSFTPLQNQCQYFWKPFSPARTRTTYLFTLPWMLTQIAGFGGSIRGLSGWCQNIRAWNNSRLQLQGHCLDFPSYRQVHCDHRGAAFCQSEIAAIPQQYRGLWRDGCVILSV